MHSSSKLLDLVEVGFQEAYVLRGTTPEYADSASLLFSLVYYTGNRSPMP